MNELEVERVLAIAAEAAVSDGVEHLDEAARLELEYRPGAVGGVVNENGFAVVTGSTLAVVVRPERRGHERARALLARIPGAATAAWSHADHPAARHLAAEYSWRRDRELLRMTRAARLIDINQPELDTGLIDINQPERHTRLIDVNQPGDRALRTFEPGDEAEVIRVNAAAFAQHPEQGGLTPEGLRERMAEWWFDAADLVEVWEGARLAGFHWVKRHPGGLGEVYVLAVDPAFAGNGLGAIVLEAGLERLNGLPVQLYVESDNTKARRLYESAGFAVAEVHAHYALF